MVIYGDVGTFFVYKINIDQLKIRNLLALQTIVKNLGLQVTEKIKEEFKKICI